jgi:deoxyribodipyrimidine photo-lyase
MTKLFIFYRDLRFEDNTSLKELLKHCNVKEVTFACIEDSVVKTNRFVRDMFTSIIKSLSESHNIKIHIFSSYKAIDQFISSKHNIDIIAMNKNLLIWKNYQEKIINKFKEKTVICKEDYTIGTEVDVLNNSSTPYKVFTPFYHKYLKVVTHVIGKSQSLPPTPSIKTNTVRNDAIKVLASAMDLKDYGKARNYPEMAAGTSHIGKYLSYGVISIREAATCFQNNPELLRQVICKDFYYFSYEHQKCILKSKSNSNNSITWHNATPFILAGVQQLTTTGWVNNRLRMIIAMFLIKKRKVNPLAVERWFSKHMIDYYEPSNTGGVAWAVAQPQFKEFNYTLQSKKYDPQGKYTSLYLKSNSIL